MRKMVIGLFALAVSSAAFAQTYPNRPLRAVIPWPPGQATDLVGRVIAQKLSEVLGQPVVDRLFAAMATVMQASDVRERLTAVGLEVDYAPTDEFSRYLKEQRTRFADIIKTGNIKVE